MIKLNRRSILLILAVAVCSAVITSAIILTWYNTGRHQGNQVFAHETQASERAKITPASFNTTTPSSWENAVINVNKKVSPAVVYIDTERTVRGMVGVPDLFREFFGDQFFENYPQSEYKQQGTGSGFIIKYKNQEYIITNNHVIEGADKITINLKSGEKYQAKVIGADSNYDLAVLKIDANNLPYVELGDSDSVVIGQWVVAIGNPFGLHETVTIGIISALNRSLKGLNESSLIQTDAAINPGNSGGPLVDLEGKVVGINEAIISNAQGIGFAIPIDLLKNNLEDLITKGSIPVTTPWIGIYPETVSKEMASYYGLPFQTGVYVKWVVKGSPAGKADIEPGDIITEINGRKMESADDLYDLIKNQKIGDTINLTIWRKNKFQKIKVVLEARPEE